MVDKIMKAIRETEASAEKIVEEAETRSKDIVAELITHLLVGRRAETCDKFLTALEKNNGSRIMIYSGTI